ncbi:hypothetical protein [Citrobacter sp. JGM124]|uniref:hypothetical protein n=1 Tax=Citrobacter sp. JGM124 TaxID=2799789 RepID=UPI001BABD789|nr:hypothetical protein [Citrobacter sp. JGM124]MBS0848689.1 hypothetical protein [Citrobacter sp. JGM124]
MIKENTMKFIISGLIASGLTGCSLFLPPEDIQLHRLSNDELCHALGTYNDDGKMVLAIHNELDKKIETIDSERCHAIETKAKMENDIIKNSNEWVNNKQQGLIKTQDEILRKDNEINRLLNKPAITPQRYRVSPAM